jgi:hypothetical protein
MLRRVLALAGVCCAGLRRTPRANPCSALPALQRGCHADCAGEGVNTPQQGLAIMNTDAFHISLALIDYLAAILPRVHMHDPALARSLRSAATAMPQHIAAAEPARLARAHAAALRAHVMLTVVQAWGYAPGDDLTAALDTARRLHALTAPA